MIKNVLLLIFTIFIGTQAFSASLSGMVWQDLNKNNLKDAGEPGVENMTVYLLLHPSGDTISFQTTDVSGFYKFDNMATGDYLIAVDLTKAPIGWKNIASLQVGFNGQIDCDFHANAICNPLSLPDNNLQIINIDLGLQISKTAILSGKAWRDANGNSLQDNGEVGMVDVYVSLIDTLGTTVHVDTTDAMGQYTFPPADSNRYTVQFNPNSFPQGYHPVNQNVGGDDTVDSDADATGLTSSIELYEDVTHIDLGLSNVVSENLGGKVWFDGDNNGQYAAGEIGIPNVIVRLLDESNTELAKDTTDLDGLYQFNQIALGNYYIEFDTASYASSYVIVSMNQGGDDNIDSDAFANGKTELIVFSTTLLTVDLGLYSPPTTGAVNGKVWQDQNTDNIYSFGESLIANIPVFLIDMAGDTTMTQSTNTMGQYAFANVSPAEYKIAFDLGALPADYSIVAIDFGVDDSVDSDVDTFGLSDTFMIIAGNTISAIDMGFSLPFVITPMTTDTVSLTVEQDGSVLICLDTTELNGLFDNAHICEAPTHGEATDFTGNCFTYFPDLNYVGDDSFCVVVCDENSCDTTFVNISILESTKLPPIAVNDIDTVIQGTPEQLMILANDTLHTPLKQLTILDYPTLGSATVDTFGFIRYIPEPNICDETVSLTYEVCTSFGCDTAEVSIYLDCNNIKIVEGFSPNGDGINETFVIKGISEYPDNTLTIFNRWGNQVFFQEKYENTWDGYWDDEKTYLPSGTYFYVFDTGNGGRMTGSFELTH